MLCLAPHLKAKIKKKIKFIISAFDAVTIP